MEIGAVLVLKFTNVRLIERVDGSIKTDHKIRVEQKKFERGFISNIYGK